MIGINQIHRGKWEEEAYKLPEKCASLIIADPPYFEVKGKFDFVWKSFDDYLIDVEKWAKACKYVLADNGTLLWYGHAKKIAYSQVVLDRYFNLENSLIWEKKECQTKRQDFEQSRCFAPVTERILMYSNEIGRTGLEEIKLDMDNFKPLRNYFEAFQKDTGLTKTDILKTIGQKADHCFRWGSTQWDMPTPETYQELLKLPHLNGFIRKEYEELRKEYEELRRPFNNHLKLTDVLKFSQEAHITKNYDHDTKKPETLTRALINTCSRPNDLIIAPFSGSGTECAMAAKEGRRFIGFDLEQEYVDMGNNRAEEFLNANVLQL